MAGTDVGALGREPFRLLRCGACGVAFKHPMIPPSTLQECYESSAPNHWVAPSTVGLRRFGEVERLAAQLAEGRRVLDIGCSNGAMLGAWDASWEKYGVEPSRRASGVAASNGIHVLAEDVAGLPLDMRFDVITLLDVVEHISDPAAFWPRLARHLAPRGILLVLTGTTDHWWWRWAKGGYWYVSFPEHVCFYSHRTFRHLADSLGLDIRFEARTAHAATQGGWTYMVQLAKNLAYRLPNALVEAGFLPRLPWLRRGYPSFTEARDHVLAVLAAR